MTKCIASTILDTEPEMRVRNSEVDLILLLLVVPASFGRPDHAQGGTKSRNRSSMQDGAYIEPATTVLPNPLIAFLRPPLANGISEDLRLVHLLPKLSDRVNDPPSEFHFITAGKQAGITIQCIQQQALVSCLLYTSPSPRDFG